MKDTWPEALEQELFALRDTEYKRFHCRLMPTIDPDTVIGVRTPELRRLAKAFSQKPEARAFLESLPHTYYEENNLHGILISEMKDSAQVLTELERFLPYVDNWATCDMLCPKVFLKDSALLLPKIRQWLESNHTYTVRFGIGMLLKFYLDEAFQPQYLSWVAAVINAEYYVRMMVAWYFATALAKQYAQTIPYFTGCRLPRWTHNKAIQKAVESRRITPEQKDFLRSLRLSPE